MGLAQRREERAKAANLERYGYAVVDAEEARRLSEAAATSPPTKKKLSSTKKNILKYFNTSG